MKPQKDKKRIYQRHIFFCLGYSNIWLIFVSKTIRLLIKLYNLFWLRVRISTHHFPNLREIFSADTTKKLYRNVVSIDSVCRPCNFNSLCKTDGKCAYGGCCKQTGIVYEVKCKHTNKSYIVFI